MYFVLLVLFHIILLLNNLKIAKLSVHQITSLNVRTRGVEKQTRISPPENHTENVWRANQSRINLKLHWTSYIYVFVFFFVFFLFCCHDHFSSNTLCFTVIFFILPLNILETQKLLISQSPVSRHNHDFTQSSSCLFSQIKSHRIRTTHITRFESVIFCNFSRTSLIFCMILTTRLTCWMLFLPFAHTYILLSQT